MSWWFEWPPLLLLLVVVNAGAELLLLKHGENLYCVSDDPDTSALAWNYDLHDYNLPREEVYWSPPLPTTYSGLNCKPKFEEQQKCGDWNISSWRNVKSYESDLPPVLDFRWNVTDVCPAEPIADPSPIALNSTTAIKVDLPPLNMKGHNERRPEGFDMENNGNGVEIRYRGKNQPIIEGGGLKGTYVLDHVKIIWDSEHTIDNKQYDLEMQFVHYKRDYTNIEYALKNDTMLVVVSFLFKAMKQNNADFDGLISGLSKIREAFETTQIGPTAMMFLNQFSVTNLKNFFQYEGSVTITPCAERAKMLVAIVIGKVGVNQVNEFRKLQNYEGNSTLNNKQDINEDFDGPVYYSGTFSSVNEIP